MPQALIVDPALVRGAGHHLPAALGWAAAAHANGFEPTILAHADCDLGDAGGFPIRRVFDGYAYGVANNPEQSPENALRLRQSAIRDNLLSALEQIESDSVLVVTFATVFTLNGVAAWASGIPPADRPSLVVWLLNGPADDEFARASSAPELLMQSIDRLKGLFGEKASFLAATQSVAGSFADSGCGLFPVFPFIAVRPTPASRSKGDGEAADPLVAIVGDFNLNKGSTLIAPLVRAVAKRRPSVRWVIAGADQYAPHRDSQAIRGLADKFSTVEVKLSAGGVPDYDSVLRSADLVVLPYSGEYYRGRGSGVAEEASLLGVPMVAPIELVEQPASGAQGAVPFRRWTADTIAHAVTDALDRLPQLSTAAKEAGLQRRREIRDLQIEMLPKLFRPAEPEGAPRVPATPSLPAVDIIVTLHNYRRFIGACLQSVARQTYPNWHCVVVDDGSSDLSFAEGRALVGRFGPRFTYERHPTARGQLQAIATGLSLGSSPFVALLDADDELHEHALEHHVAWHLNAHQPVAMTSGGLQVVDARKTVVAGALDTNARARLGRGHRLLAPDAALRRSGMPVEPSAAIILDQAETVPGEWFWNPTSTLVLRRAVIELALPRRFTIGRYAGDTYLAFTAHAIGGSILIDACVALYRRHGRNGHSDGPVLGTGTLPSRAVASDWGTVASLFTAHLNASLPRFRHELAASHVDRLLADMSRAARGKVQDIPDPGAANTPQGTALGLMDAVAQSTPYGKLLGHAVRRIGARAAGRVTTRPTGRESLLDAMSTERLFGHLTRRTLKLLGVRSRRRR
jgi:glycosyltransferase involved in cell wall biosynthesis